MTNPNKDNKDSNLLKDCYPEIFAKLDREKNAEEGINIDELTHGSNKRAWFECKEGHSLDKIVRSVVRSKNGLRCEKCLSVAFNYPDLKEEWHPKNDLSPWEVTYGSGKKVWWDCSNCGHEFPTMVKHRTKGHGCPKCNRPGRQVTDENRLTTNFPEIAKEWHPKNDLDPSDVSYASNKKPWWLCSDCSYEYPAQVDHRTLEGNGCPKCNNPGTGWEEAFMEYLDEKGTPYEHHPDPLITGVGRYEPDFYLPKEDKYIEVKAECWQQISGAKQHFKICMRRSLFNDTIEYRYGEDLKEEGIIE